VDAGAARTVHLDGAGPVRINLALGLTSLMDANGHHEESTFDLLWDTAWHEPGHVALGRLPDGWDGWVNCAVQFEGDEGTVMLDFPADRLVAAIVAAVRERNWRVVQRRAVRLKGPESPLRYVFTLRPRFKLEPEHR
jgi:hypothetical protein